uniref:uncharacterized protein C1orf112 homolog n=1 Tax=Styela clava TaxID=7725 RepID=UPI00193994C4|nr:uncharacterized protein C1orf112 homolog [Styela clava]
MDNMLLGATWKLLLSFLSEFKKVLSNKLTIEPYIALLCANVHDCMKYTSELSIRSAHLLSSGDLPTQKAFSRSCKFSMFFLSSLATIIKQYGSSICGDDFETFMKFIDNIVNDLDLTLTRNKDFSNLEKQYYSDAIIEIENIFRILLSEDAYIQFFKSLKLDACSLSLLLGMAKILVTNGEEINTHWFVTDDTSSANSCAIIHLIKQILESDEYENSGTSLLLTDFKCSSSRHDAGKILLFTLISCLHSDIYPSVELILVENMFSSRLPRSIMAMDLLDSICRSSSKLCGHYFTLFLQLIESTNGLSFKIPIPVMVTLKFLQRIAPLLSNEVIKTFNSEDIHAMNVITPYRETLKPNFQFIFISVCKEFNHEVNSWIEGSNRLLELSKLLKNFDKILEWIFLVQNRSRDQPEKRKEISQGEQILATAILKLLKFIEFEPYLEKFIVVTKFLSLILHILNSLTFSKFEANDITWMLYYFSSLLRNGKLLVNSKIIIAQLLQKFELKSNSTDVENEFLSMFVHLITDENWRVKHQALSSFEFLTRTSSGTFLLEKCVNLPTIVMNYESHLRFQILDENHLTEIKSSRRKLEASNFDKCYQSWIKKQEEKRKLSIPMKNIIDSKKNTQENTQVLHLLRELNKTLSSVDTLLKEGHVEFILSDEQVLKKFSNSKLLFSNICDKLKSSS